MKAIIYKHPMHGERFGTHRGMSRTHTVRSPYKLFIGAYVMTYPKLATARAEAKARGATTITYVTTGMGYFSAPITM